MTKCGVWISRKRSAGSKRLAASAAVTSTDSSAAAASAEVTPRRLAGLGSGPGITRGAGEYDAQDEGRNSQQCGADEEARVRLGQRAADAQRIHPHARESLRSFADVGVGRTQQRVLRRGIPEAGETRH